MVIDRLAFGQLLHPIASNPKQYFGSPDLLCHLQPHDRLPPLPLQLHGEGRKEMVVLEVAVRLGEGEVAGGGGDGGDIRRRSGDPK